MKLTPGSTLFVDGHRKESANAVREFSTPPLAQGEEFAYVMKAELVRNGQPESQSMKVVVRAGEIQTVDLTMPNAQRAGR